MLTAGTFRKASKCHQRNCKSGQLILIQWSSPLPLADFHGEGFGPHALSLTDWFICCLSGKAEVAIQALLPCWDFSPEATRILLCRTFLFVQKKLNKDMSWRSSVAVIKANAPYHLQNTEKNTASGLPISTPSILLVSSAWQDNHQTLKTFWWKSSSQKLTLLHAYNTWHLLTLCFQFLKIVHDYASHSVLVYWLAIQSSKSMSDLDQQHCHDYIVITT